MGRYDKRYKQMERYMTLALLADLVLFVLFLISSGSGTIWAKVVTAIFSIALSGLCIAYLYLTQELLRKRSLWMTTTAVCIIACVIFSLLLRFPSPSPL